MFYTQPIPDLQSSKGDKSCIKIKIKGVMRQVLEN